MTRRTLLADAKEAAVTLNRLEVAQGERVMQGRLVLDPVDTRCIT
jgi:hypothetical protein